MKKYDLDSCGTVMSLDLAADKDFGHIVVELDELQIKRIIDVLAENYPDKTPFDKKCKDSLRSKLFSGRIKVQINLIPVLNKTVLKQWKAYRVSRPRQAGMTINS